MPLFGRDAPFRCIGIHFSGRRRHFAGRVWHFAGRGNHFPDRKNHFSGLQKHFDDQRNGFSDRLNDFADHRNAISCRRNDLGDQRNDAAGRRNAGVGRINGVYGRIKASVMRRNAISSPQMPVSCILCAVADPRMPEVRQKAISAVQKCFSPSPKPPATRQQCKRPSLHSSPATVAKPPFPRHRPC